LIAEDLAAVVAHDAGATLDRLVVPPVHVLIHGHLGTEVGVATFLRAPEKKQASRPTLAFGSNHLF
jgi:hypothetical protein